ncbi:MAG: hypothetical protein ACRDHX_07755 [Chloroflexota bacterium]
MIDVKSRADLVASNLEQVPDEAYLGFGMASIFTALALYLVGRKDEALFVGMLGSSFATLTLMLKLLANGRA